MTSQRIQPKMLFQGAAEEEEEPTTIVDVVVKGDRGLEPTRDAYMHACASVFAAAACLA